MSRRIVRALLIAGAAALLVFAARCDQAWFDRHVFLPQQFFIVADHAIVWWARAGAVIAAAGLLALVRFPPRRRFLWACLLALPAAEAALQWKSRHLVLPELVRSMDALTSPDPRYGVTLKPSIDRLDRAGRREIRWITDDARRRIGGRPIDESAPSLVFAGESTVVGAGLQWEETFPAMLGERMRLQVMNLASMAYSIDQSLLRLRDHLPRLRRPAAVIGFFMPGLLGRARPPSALDRIGLYRIFRHLYFSDGDIGTAMDSVGAALAEMSDLARARGVPCVFVVTGHTPDWMRRELFDARGLDAVVVEVTPEELLPEGHPGPAGTARIADALERRLRTESAQRNASR
ncbi:MAG: hypothetical protein ABR567_15040 [Myxococcales bacterium]|nr:hypothetical protein [Myxococcales bacterium]